MVNLQERIKEQENIIMRQAKRVADIVERTRDEVIQPGYYDVTETDGGGMRDWPQFTIKVENAINLKELALQLIERKNYMSPWNDLRVRPADVPKVFTIN